VKLAARVDGLEFDVASCVEDCVAASEVDLGWREIVQALVVAAVVVVLDEGCDGALHTAWQILAVEQNAALQRPMPPLDLALRHRMIGSHR
jgi:hypothetical protein